MKNKKKELQHPPRCPYCGSTTILRGCEEIYLENRDNSKLYVCKNFPTCDAYVRVQKGTTKPLGTIANGRLRALRREAHNHFDQLYRRGYMSKDEAYQWLAIKMFLPQSEAHIGMMGEYRCRQVIDICDKELEGRERAAATRRSDFLKGEAIAS